MKKSKMKKWFGKKDTVKYSIVIPSCNGVEVIKPLIDSIIKYTDLSNCEVIVACNGSPKAMSAYIKILGEPFKLLWADNKIGVASAFNMGCKEAKGEFVILMNDDSVLLEQTKNKWIEILTEPMQEEQVGIAGKLHRDWSSNQDFIISFCTIIKNKVFKDVGYFDERFNPYFGEDVDFNIRAKMREWKIAGIEHMPLYHKSHTEGAPTAKSAKVISQKSNILRERYNKDSFGNCPSIWEISQTTGHYHSEELAKELEGIPKTDLVIDLGCGLGYYCKHLEDKGYDVIAVEGTRDIETKSFYKPIFRWDLSKDLVLPGLPSHVTVLSLEVGEHIPKEYEDVFINNITKHASRVIMSWAVPGQGGDGHVNERPNDYIKDKMRKKGFAFDSMTTGRLRDVMKDSPLWWFKSTLMVFEKVSVTAVIPTRNRYFTTLPLCLMSIANQTLKPEAILIYDDGEQKDLRAEPLYQNIFAMLDANKIKWAVNFGVKKGQAYSHQKSLADARTTWIWRIDDDNVAEPDVLEKLVSNISSDVGAVGGVVVDPKHNVPRPKLASNKIEDIYAGLNIQWYNQPAKIEEVDHLYSTFIVRKEAGLVNGYCLDAPIHREETIFTYEIKRLGWRVLVDTSARTWHLNEQSGGIRDDKRIVFESCERVFAAKMKGWGVTPTKVKYCVLDNGMGDHLMFKKILPEIREKNPNAKIVVACCYNEIFEDDKDITMVSIGDAKVQFGNIDRWNIYKYMWDNKDKMNLEDAFRRMYL